MYPKELKYSKEHEWLKMESDGKARVGITFYAQKELGDVVYVDLPTVGSTVKAGDGFAVVESVKAVSDIYAPVSGTVVEVNERLIDEPELINEDPYGRGWLVLMEVDDPHESQSLLSAEEYQAIVGED